MEKTKITRAFSLIIALCVFTSLNAQSVSNYWRLAPSGKGNAEKILPLGADRYLYFGKNKLHAYLTVVNKHGKPFLLKNFKSVIGGKRSEFTDALQTQKGFVFIGDCDHCDPALPLDTARRILLLETDFNFNVTRKKLLMPPVNIFREYQIWGYERIKQDGNDFIAMTQLIYPDKGVNPFDDDTLKTDICLTKFNDSLNVVFHKAYDIHPLDNQGDIQVASDGYHVMTWGVNEISLTADNDTTSLYQFTKNTGEIAREWKYTGTGFAMARIGADWLIGGSETVTANFFVEGSQAMISRVNGETGTIKAKYVFGNALLDGIRDIKVLQNGNILVAVVEDADCVNLANLGDFNGIYLYPESFPYPKNVKVYRLNPNTLQPVDQPTVFPNPNKEDILLRSVFPLNADGTQFVSCGQFYRKPWFWSRTTATLSNSGTVNGDEDSEVRGASNFSAVPNPVVAGGILTLTFEASEQQSKLEVFDLAGKLISVKEIPGGQNFAAAQAPEQMGIYLVRFTNGRGEVSTSKISVSN